MADRVSLDTTPAGLTMIERARQLYRHIGTVITVAERRTDTDADHLSMLRTLREWEAEAKALGWPNGLHGTCIKWEPTGITVRWEDDGSEGFLSWAEFSGHQAFTLSIGTLATSSPPQIDCPLCGVTVTQVASATLSLALSQHVR